MREYEAAKTHRTEVPKMLFNLRMFADLNAYVDSKADRVRALSTSLLLAMSRLLGNVPETRSLATIVDTLSAQ